MRYANYVSYATLLLVSFSATGKDLTTLDDVKLCAKYAHRQNDKVLAEIDRRELLRPEYRDAVLNSGLVIGMTSIEALCAWGMPSRSNDTTTASGTRSQWVYSTYLGASVGSIYRFVYIRNGLVEAIQN